MHIIFLIFLSIYSLRTEYSFSFGGCDLTDCSNDLIVNSLTSESIGINSNRPMSFLLSRIDSSLKIHSSTNSPQGRSGSLSIPIGPFITLIGGRDFEKVFNDFWIYSNNKWSQISDKLPFMTNHIGTIWKNNFIALIGGYNEHQNERRNSIVLLNFFTNDNDMQNVVINEYQLNREIPRETNRIYPMKNDENSFIICGNNDCSLLNLGAMSVENIVKDLPRIEQIVENENNLLICSDHDQYVLLSRDLIHTLRDTMKTIHPDDGKLLCQKRVSNTVLLDKGNFLVEKVLSTVLNCPNNCHNHGECLDKNGGKECKCFIGFDGYDCRHSQSECVLNNRVCSGHGECRQNECFCLDGFSGKYCEMGKADCDCNGRGNCVVKKGEDNSSPPVLACNCDFAWEGQTCNVKASCPFDCCGHGDCRSNQCVCHDGWTGEACHVSPQVEHATMSLIGDEIDDINMEMDLIKGHPSTEESGRIVFLKEKKRKLLNKMSRVGQFYSEGNRGMPTECLTHQNLFLSSIQEHLMNTTTTTNSTSNESDCPSQCNFKGICDGGTCFCEPGRTGVDCSEPSATSKKEGFNMVFFIVLFLSVFLFVFIITYFFLSWNARILKQTEQEMGFCAKYKVYMQNHEINGEPNITTPEESNNRLTLMANVSLAVFAWYISSMSLTATNKFLFGSDSFPLQIPLTITCFHFWFMSGILFTLYLYSPKLILGESYMTSRDYNILNEGDLNIDGNIESQIDHKGNHMDESHTINEDTSTRRRSLSIDSTLPVQLANESQESPSIISKIKRFGPIALFATFDICFSNLSYSLIPISVITVVKSSSVVWIFILAVLFGLERFQWKMFLVCFIIMFSVSMCIVFKQSETDETKEESVFTTDFLFGIIFVLIAVLSLAFRWVIVQKMSISFKPITLMSYTQPMSAILLTPIALFIEGGDIWNFLFDQNEETRLRLLEEDTGEYAEYVFPLLVFSSGFLAFCLILSEYRLVHLTSSLSLCIAGIGKEILTIVLSIIVFGDIVNLMQWLFILLSIIGIGYYGYIRWAEIGSHRKNEESSGE